MKLKLGRNGRLTGMDVFLIIVFFVWVIITYQIFWADTGDEKSKSNANQTGKTEIVFWHAMGGPLGEAMDKLIDKYNNDPNSKCYVKTINMGGYDTLQKKLLASLIANEAPDVAQCFETLTKKFIKHDKIVCIDDLINADIEAAKKEGKSFEDIRDDIIPALRINNTFAGKLYSFPFNKSVQVLYYNKDMFQEVGLDPEKPPRTFKELREYCQKIVDFYKAKGEKDKYGYGCAKSNNWSFLNRIKANKGYIVKRDTDGILKCGFNEKAAIDSLCFLQDMLKDGLAKEGQAFDHQNEFMAKKCGIIESSVTSKIYMNPDFRLGMAPVPGIEDESLPGGVYRSTILSGTNICIFKNEDPKKVEGAWDFIKWFTNTENGVDWSIGTTYMPVRISSVNSEKMKQKMQEDPNLNAIYGYLDNLAFEPRITAWFEIRDLIADYLERCTLEHKDPKLYCAEMERDINGMLRHVTDTDDNKELGNVD